VSDDDATRRLDRDDPEATHAHDPEATQTYDPFADEPTSVDESTKRIVPPPVPEAQATQRMTPAVAAASGPHTERLAMRQERNMAGWLVALAIVVALAVGGAIGYAQSGGSDEGEVARMLVGAQGGVIEFGKIGRVEIPADALPTATAITVRKVTNENRVRLGTEGDPRSVLYEPGELQMYAFEPADLRFQHPVKITIPRPNKGEALLVDTPDGAQVVAAKETDGDSALIETMSFSFDG
jgi:hypothetical protein